MSEDRQWLKRNITIPLIAFLSLMSVGNCLVWCILFESNSVAENPKGGTPMPSTLPTNAIQPETSKYDRTFGPAYILWAHRTPLPELQAWAKHWTSETAMDQAHLAKLIESSDLSALECLQIGRLMAHDEGYEVGKCWIEKGLQRSEIELRAYTASHSKTQSLLRALAAAQDRLEGHSDAASLIEKINASIIEFAPTTGSDQTRNWARLHQAEALILAARYSDAELEAKSLAKEASSSRKWTNDERRKLTSLLARIPVDSEATSPVDVVAAHAPQSSELFQWMKKWQETESTPLSFERDWGSDVTILGSLAQRAGLSADVSLRVSELMFDKDAWNAEIFAQIGVDRAQATLADTSSTDTSAWPTIYALERVEAKLWDIEGNATNRGHILEGITSILMRFEREDPWDQRPEWAKIGHGEALYLQGQYSSALKEADALINTAKADSHYTGAEKAGIYWLQAVILFDTGRFKDALQPLEYTATHTEFAHAKEATPLWAIALAKSGNASEANRVFDDWIRQDRPTIEVASHVLEKIEGDTIR
jgi:tetratricopeptide (TPR) repeat protein